MIDLDQIKGLKGPPPSKEKFFLFLTPIVVMYSAFAHHWSEWAVYGGVGGAALLAGNGIAMASLKSEGKTSATWKEVALIAFLIALLVGAIAAAFGLTVRDVVKRTLLDETLSATTRAASATTMVLVLARYLYSLKGGMRSSYGSAEILGAVAIVWLTAEFGPKAAPTVPLFIVGLLSGAFLVAQGVENIKAGLSGHDDLLAALMLNLFPTTEQSSQTRMEASSQLPAGLPDVSDSDLAAQKMLLVVSTSLVSSYEKYTGWLVTGFAAVAALVVANHDQVVKATNESIPKSIVWFFLWATAVHAIQRLANVFVQGATSAAQEGEKIGESIGNSKEPHALPNMLSRIRESYPWPLRFFIGLAFAKILRGELLFMPRLVLKTAIFSVMLLPVQIGLAVATIWKIASGL